MSDQDPRPLLDWPAFLRDPQFWSLAGFNLLAVALTVFSGAGAWPLLLAYWADSVALGAFNVVRMLAIPLDRGATEPPPKVVRQWRIVRLGLAGFFMVHYGGFQAVYFSIINGSVRDWFGERTPIDGRALGLTIAALFAHRLFGFIQEHRKPPLVELSGGLRLPLYMFLPYARVVPVHLLILGGSVLALVAGVKMMGILVGIYLFALRFAGEFIAYVFRRGVERGKIALPAPRS